MSEKMIPVSAEPDETGILPDPALEALKEEIQTLRAEAAELITRRDDLKNRICPDLERRYMRELGTLEYLVFQKQTEILALRRMIQLVQQDINSRRRPDRKAVQEQLQKEYKTYEKQYRQAQDQYHEAREKYRRENSRSLREISGDEDQNATDQAGNTSAGGTSGPGGSGAPEAEDREAAIKSIYKRLIKRLHPDINPDITQRELELFYRLVEAYKAQDLEALREIELILDQESDYANTLKNGTAKEQMTALKAERRRLLEQIRKLQREIAEIERSFPYNRLSILENPEELQRRREALEQELSALEEQEKVLRERYRILVEEYQKEKDKE